MARASNPSGLIPNVWDDGTDLFDHTQLAANWDATDANLTRLNGERATLGDLKSWYLVDTSADLTVLFPDDGANGWVICDGRTISNSAHDFRPGGSTDIRINGVGLDGSNNLHLPDFRGASFVGAGIPSHQTAGTTGPQANHTKVDGSSAGDANYPGIGGFQGGNAKIEVPDHHHRHNHIHQIGDGASNGTTEAGQDDSSDPYFVNTDASGSGHNLTLTTHEHIFFKQYGSSPRDPTNSLKRQKDVSGTDLSLNNLIQTSKQVASTGGTDEVPTPTTGPGNDASGALLMDARPTSIGVLVLMYVHAQTT